MNDLTITTHNNEIKYMPQGRVNGRYVTMRARYLDELEARTQAAKVRVACAFIGGITLAAILLIASSYWIG